MAVEVKETHASNPEDFAGSPLVEEKVSIMFDDRNV